MFQRRGIKAKKLSTEQRRQCLYKYIEDKFGKISNIGNAAEREQKAEKLNSVSDAINIPVNTRRMIGPKF